MSTKKTSVPKKAITKTTAKKTVKATPKTKAKKTTKSVAKKPVTKTKSVSVKKSTAKTKTSVKKSKTETKSVPKKKDLVYADNETSFWVTDGQILNSLLALNEALNNMDTDVFEHHVTEDKHDFAEWVELVLADQDCATKLREAKTPDRASEVVSGHLRIYRI